MRLLRYLLAALLVLVVFLLVNTWRVSSRQPAPLAVPALSVDAEASARRLSGALKIATVSPHEEDPASLKPFLELQDYFAAQFPRAYAALKPERIGEGALLLRWEGRNPALPPVLLTAHLDVVPADDAAQWQQPPFAGVIKDGFVWGRGAIDDKGSALGMLEAIELLLAEGRQPERTLLLGFGFDEEIGGKRGAQAIARTLAERGIKPDWVMDEGGALLHQSPLPVKVPVATIGIAEKGYLSVRLDAEAKGGHSSMPTGESAIEHLSRALERVHASPPPVELSGVTGSMFDWLTPEMPFVYRVAFANRSLLGPVLARRVAGSPSGSALLRTTQVPTILEAGRTDNVVPPKASAVLNLRLLPGDTEEGELARLRQIIDDPAITLTALPGHRPSSAISPVDHAGFKTIGGTIRGVFPGTVIAPYLVVGATDARHYGALTPAVYRFLPVPLAPDDLKRFHGRDERIAIQDYVGAIRFYHQLIAVSTAH